MISPFAKAFAFKSLYIFFLNILLNMPKIGDFATLSLCQVTVKFCTKFFEGGVFVQRALLT